MFKNILSLLVIGLAFLTSVYAQETVNISIGGDRTVSSGSTVDLIAEVGGTCSNLNIATIYWMEPNDKSDWSTVQGGGIENTHYSFIASETKQVKAKIFCPIGEGPIFTNEVVNEDIVTIYVSEPSGPTVSAGSDARYSYGDIVNLSGSISGSPCTVFTYSWEQISGPTVEISNSGAIMLDSNIFDGASFVFPNTTDEIKIKLLVSPQSCIDSANTYSGIVTFKKKSNGGGTSYSDTMKTEAEKLFYDSGTIEKIDLILGLVENPYFPLLTFNWNNIGGNGQVYYILEYSTGYNFENYQRFETTSLSYDIMEYVLNTESWEHFFRVKAGYLGKTCEYSNIITYYSDDYLKVSCQKCKPKVNFSDILRDIDVILEGIFNISCKTCKINHYDK